MTIWHRGSDPVMPAEWEPHEATWLTWPTSKRHWGSRLEALSETYDRMVRVLAESEKVRILVPGPAWEKKVRARLAKTADPRSTEFFRIKAHDIWIRDYGPIFVRQKAEGGRRKEIAAACWKFNAWGGKYRDLMRDNGVALSIAREIGIPAFSADYVLEGGALDSNGKGLFLSTKSCLLNSNRNSPAKEKDLMSALRKFLGVEKIQWVKGQLQGDDTDGHVDNLARFVGPRTVLGSEMPEPRPLYEGGRRLPASHLNFYVANRAVLVPVFGGKSDARALGILKDLFPGRKVEGIDSRVLVRGCGAVHCVTQQQPL